MKVEFHGQPCFVVLVVDWKDSAAAVGELLPALQPVWQGNSGIAALTTPVIPSDGALL